MAQNVENAKSQSKTFHVRKRSKPSDTPEQSERSIQPLKMGKGAGGVKMPEKLGETPSREVPPKGNQSGRNPQKGNSQTSQAVTPHVTCGYCGKFNHTKVECFKKTRQMSEVR